jgi:hypothetical protein
VRNRRNFCITQIILLSLKKLDTKSILHIPFHFILAKAKLALNTKWVMASPFGITRQIFASFTRLVCQTNVLNLFCMRKNHDLSGIQTRELLGFKSAMLPTEPWRSFHISYYIHSIFHIWQVKIEICVV